MSMHTYKVEDLRRLCVAVLTLEGMEAVDATIVADALLRADLESASSHGISRLPLYVSLLKEGRINARPNITTVEQGPVLKVDGDHGAGQVVATRALEQGIQKAKATGLVGIAIRRSNHFGAAAYYCQKACDANMILIAMTNSPPGIPPWGGARPFFGTNPIAFGFPVQDGPPVIVDMSTSVVARGKIILAAKKGEQIPPGWAINQDGVETTNPEEALKGAMLPIAGAKGYALAMAVEILSGILTGAAFGPHVQNYFQPNLPPSNVGHFFILLDIQQWMPLNMYFDRMRQLIDELKNVPRAKGFDAILYPGERRHQSYVTQLRRGVALPENVVAELNKLADQYGVKRLKSCG